MSEQGAIRYGEWSKDRQGWLFGLSGGALITVTLTGLPALLAIGTHQWLLALGWLPVWALLAAGVCVPVRGRPAVRWLIDASLRAVGQLAGWSAWQSRAAGGDMPDAGQADLPGVLSGIRVHDGPAFGASLARPALVQDSAAQTWAAVARISHPGIGLAEQRTRDRMAAGLAELLEGAATGELVSVVAVQIRTVPDDGAERAAWQARHVRTGAPPLTLRVNEELGAAMVQAGVRHEAFVTVVVPESRIARQAKEAGGGVDGRARVLYGVMSEVEVRLLGPVGCASVVWLDTPSLAAAIRTGYAPGDRAALVQAQLAGAETAAGRPAGPDGTTPGTAPGTVPGVGHGGLPMAAAGPSAAPASDARHYTHDAWSTATCTVLLPDQGAIMGALAPVLAPSVAGERRSVTEFYEPISRAKASKMVGRESMSAGTAAEMRARMGFKARAVHRRDEQRVATVDHRLASGKALVRVAIAAAVTVPSEWSITDFGRRLEASIRGSGFTPLRLDLAQDTGFAAACIPLGIGLPRRRDTR